MRKTFDVIVLGLGCMGSAAVLSLARKGLRVCGVEQFGMAHDRGSSHGETRIIRKAYFEHPDYVPLLMRAYELWQEISRESGETLQTRCGLVLSGKPDSETVRGLQQCYEKHRLAHEQWTAEEARRHFPCIRFPEEHTVFFDPEGGFIRAERSTQAMLELAQKHGADLLLHTPVRKWHETSAGITLTTESGNLHAGALVVTAGAWSHILLHELGLPLNIWRRVLLWYPADREIFSARNCPAFYFEMAEGGFYGFPAVDEKGLKIGEHTRPDPCDSPENPDRSLRSNDTVLQDAFVRQVFPQAGPRHTHFTTCMYTMTPDHHFIIDRSPLHENVVFAAGFSGHGFKFAPVVGELLAALITATPTSLPWEFLRLNRFHT